jgi:hypothetical protein
MIQTKYQTEASTKESQIPKHQQMMKREIIWLIKYAPKVKIRSARRRSVHSRELSGGLGRRKVHQKEAPRGSHHLFYRPKSLTPVHIIKKSNKMVSKKAFREVPQNVKDWEKILQKGWCPRKEY